MYYPAKFVGGPWDGEDRALQSAPWQVNVAMPIEWESIWLNADEDLLEPMPMKIGTYERDERSFRYHEYMREVQHNPDYPIRYLWKGMR